MRVKPSLLETPPPERYVAAAAWFADTHGFLPLEASRRQRQDALGRGRQLLAQFRRPAPQRLMLSVVRNGDDSVDFYLFDLDHPDGTPTLASLAEDLEWLVSRSFADARVERVFEGRATAPFAAP